MYFRRYYRALFCFYFYFAEIDLVGLELQQSCISLFTVWVMSLSHHPLFFLVLGSNCNGLPSYVAWDVSYRFLRCVPMGWAHLWAFHALPPPSSVPEQQKGPFILLLASGTTQAPKCCLCSILFTDGNQSCPCLSLLTVSKHGVTLNTFVWILALGFLFVFRSKVLLWCSSWHATQSDRPGWP